MATKYTYSAQCLTEEGKWYPMGGMWADTKIACTAYIMGMRDSWPPHRAMRVIRSDGRVMEEWPQQTEVSVGMVAGWPTAEQYEAAAQRALEKAKKIREMHKQWAEDEKLHRKI